MNEEWTNVDKIARFLKSRLGTPPAVLLVLGSGLGEVASELENERTVTFEEIPGWPQSTVDGHTGMLRRGTLRGTEVLLQLGRIHLYEGYSPYKVVRPVRAAIRWGAQAVILSNAAGGINTNFRPGDLMMIEDHLNLTGFNPLRGSNDDSIGPRFLDMTEAYDSKLLAQALYVAAEFNIPLKTGVYAGVRGPTYETPAEVKMYGKMGADAVGMSTVLETLAARHMGVKVAGISCITNVAAAKRGATLNHEEVKLFAAKASGNMTKIITHIVDNFRSKS